MHASILFARNIPRFLVVSLEDPSTSERELEKYLASYDANAEAMDLGDDMMMRSPWSGFSLDDIIFGEGDLDSFPPLPPI